MRRTALTLTLALAAGLLASWATPASADPTPIPKPPTSALGTGDSVAEACQEALANLRERCLFIGPVTYSDARCTTLDPPGPLPPVEVCTCIASTLLCVNPL